MHFVLAVKFTSPKWYVFYVSEQKPDKGNKLRLYNANKSANNYENVIVVDEILWGVDLPEAVLNTYIRCFGPTHENLTMIT